MRRIVWLGATAPLAIGNIASDPAPNPISTPVVIGSLGRCVGAVSGTVGGIKLGTGLAAKGSAC